MTSEEQQIANNQDRLAREQRQNDMAERAKRKEHEKWVAAGCPAIPRGPLRVAGSQPMDRRAASFLRPADGIDAERDPAHHFAKEGE